MTPDPDAPIKVSFSLYPADMAALETLIVELRRRALPVRRGTVMRALIELTSATEMFAAAVLLHRDYVGKSGPRETDNVAGIPTVDIPQRLIVKLDSVVTDLAAKGITATRAFVVRAILRTAPKPDALAPAVRKYLKDFPRRPRTLRPVKKNARR